MLISKYMNFSFYIIYNDFCSKAAAKERRSLKIWSGSAAPILSKEQERERRSIWKERWPLLHIIIFHGQDYIVSRPYLMLGMPAELNDWVNIDSFKSIYCGKLKNFPHIVYLNNT